MNQLACYVMPFMSLLLAVIHDARRGQPASTKSWILRGFAYDATHAPAGMLQGDGWEPTGESRVVVPEKGMVPYSISAGVRFPSHRFFLPPAEIRDQRLGCRRVEEGRCEARRGDARRGWGWGEKRGEKRERLNNKEEGAGCPELNQVWQQFNPFPFINNQFNLCNKPIHHIINHMLR
ncbi:hypothetical protein BKA65DRAFT_203126 [Rhexocercosporidium sp. MPI-PUGE-AT-0058]|nr:hypothetical protein BKA65DRAFT_203126 [Rhexocercosporidium sp. MPI-PUGE-AT-0058]